MSKTYNARVKTKKDTESNWNTNNPLILDGEIIIVIDKNGFPCLKIGDGIHKYKDLEILCDINKAYVDNIIGDISTALDIINGTVKEVTYSNVTYSSSPPSTANTDNWIEISDISVATEVTEANLNLSNRPLMQQGNLAILPTEEKDDITFKGE